ncbi:MAG: ATP-binding protein [Pseudomonadota bacterium]
MQTEQLSPMIEALPVPVLWIGRNERVLASNDSARQLLGQVMEDRHYISTLRQPQVLDCIERAFRTGAPQTAKYLSSKQGRDISFDVQAAPATMNGDAGILVSFLDMTHVEEADQIRRDFVANVSHELRSPLTTVSGFIETLRGAARDDADARDRFLGTMARETDRMIRLVEDLLSLSRVESAERQRPTESVDIKDVVHNAVVHVSAVSEGAGVDIITDLPEAALETLGDFDQLIQVFINLLENAVKYGASGDAVTIRGVALDYAAQTRAPAIRVDVIDKGEGLDPIHLPRLTERFYRADDHRSRDLGGTGLGLAIVKHIVNRHRGRLKIVSAPGEGSTFSVFLPVL